MVVHQLTFADGVGGMPNGVSVLNDVLALGNVAKGKLVAGRDAGHLLQGYRYGICGVYLEKIFHLF